MAMVYPSHGALAHLGERELCKLEVTGSIPVCSTDIIPRRNFMEVILYAAVFLILWAMVDKYSTKVSGKRLIAYCSAVVTIALMIYVAFFTFVPVETKTTLIAFNDTMTVNENRSNIKFESKNDYTIIKKTEHRPYSCAYSYQYDFYRQPSNRPEFSIFVK